jgi:GAF domain-containing protein
MEPPERHNRELSILNTIAQALNREVDLQRALEGVLAQVADLLDLRTGWIWLLRDDTGRPYLAAAQNLPPALAGSPHRMEGSCYCLDTFRSGDLNGAANVNVITCSRLKGLVGDTGGLRYPTICASYIPSATCSASPSSGLASLSTAFTSGSWKSGTASHAKSTTPWPRGWQR